MIQKVDIEKIMTYIGYPYSTTVKFGKDFETDIYCTRFPRIEYMGEYSIIYDDLQEEGFEQTSAEGIGKILMLDKALRKLLNKTEESYRPITNEEFKDIELTKKYYKDLQEAINTMMLELIAKNI